jgi:hypothetical protein
MSQQVHSEGYNEKLIEHANKLALKRPDLNLLRRHPITAIRCLGILAYKVYRSISLPIQARLSALSQVPVPAKHMP